MGEILRGRMTTLCKHQRAKSLQQFSRSAAIGDILLTKRDFIPAITAYHRLIQLSPQNANAYYNLGIALQRQKQNRKRSPPSGAPLTFTAKQTQRDAKSRSRAQGIAAVISRVDVLLVPQKYLPSWKGVPSCRFIGLLVEVRRSLVPGWGKEYSQRSPTCFITNLHRERSGSSSQ